MISTNDNLWSCKCNCVSKQAHKSHWAFVSKCSKYRYLQNMKRLDLDILENETKSGLVKKLMIKKTQINKNTEQIIIVNKVVYDKEKKQIIVETNETNKLSEAKSIEKKVPLIIIQKDLLELRDLFASQYE